MARMGDSPPTDRGEFEDDVLGEAKAELASKPPLILNTFAKCVNNQLNYLRLAFWVESHGRAGRVA